MKIEATGDSRSLYNKVNKKRKVHRATCGLGNEGKSPDERGEFTNGKL